VVAEGEREASAGWAAPFVRDLRWSVSAWATDPRLLFTSFGLVVLQQALFATSRMSGAVGAVATVSWLALLAFFAGFHGVERVWYSRLMTDTPMTWAEIRILNGEFRSRNIRLGLLVGVALAVLIGPAARASNPAVHYGVLGVVVVVTDVLLTFVTVELAMTTDQVTDAWSTGLSLLRIQWPQCALYALLPPFGVQLAIQLGAGLGATTGKVIGVLAIAPLALACRGATQRYYHRECEPTPAAR
jgi:hypothetical protein